MYLATPKSRVTSCLPPPTFLDLDMDVAGQRSCPNFHATSNPTTNSTCLWIESFFATPPRQFLSSIVLVHFRPHCRYYSFSIMLCTFGQGKTECEGNALRSFSCVLSTEVSTDGIIRYHVPYLPACFQRTYSDEKTFASRFRHLSAVGTERRAGDGDGACLSLAE
jgi:hypothetical protein